MNIIKYHTTTSTNDLAKELLRQNDANSFDVIWAMNQTKGRGQRENIWLSEKGKNLTFSLILKFEDFDIVRLFDLNKVVSWAIVESLEPIIDNVKIKWPNDIMAGNHKIAGILIENTLFNNRVKNSVVGIGLNVNQVDFESVLSNVTSIKKIIGKEYDLEQLLQQIISNIENKLKIYFEGELIELDEKYISYLSGYQEYRKYSLENNEILIAKITDISKDGKLILIDNKNIDYIFGFHEIKYIY